MTSAFEPLRRRGFSFVSTVRPTPAQRRAATWVAGLSVLVFVLLAPLAKTPLPPITAFLPTYQSALVVFDLVTAVLLYGQYRLLRSRPVLLLASGYVFSAALAVAHALSFPGLFAPRGAIGAGPQTTAWLYFFWHAGFAGFILAYGLSRDHAQRHGNGASVRRSLAATALLAAIPIVFATVFHDLLPTIMAGNQDAPGKLAVALATWLVGIAALVVLWRRKSRTVLDLWLMVVLCVWIADTALAAVLNHGRFDVGWYAGRVYGLLANGFVLGVLLLESGSLYARLAKSHRLLGHALAEMRRMNADLDAFAGSLAHDLQQPLTTISAFAQIIQKSGLPEREVAHLRRIIDSTDAARDMIRGLLEFARLGESELHSQPVDLNEVVAQARGNVGADAAPQPEWEIAALPLVQGDRALLLLAFTNLLSNAVKYSRTQPQPRIRVEAERQPGGRCVIRVRDNGVGFEMAQSARLFMPFERLHSRREFEGTGMGLANVRRIVERHGGSVSAQSRPGEGATFSVVLHEARLGAGPARPAMAPA